MKRKMSRRLLSPLVVLAIVIGLLPVFVLTVLAAEPAEITQLSFSFRNPSDIPVVGDPIVHHTAGAIKTEDDRIKLTADSLQWCFDDSSLLINDTFEDHGVYFEAGRSYNTEFAFEILEPETYCVTENTNITFTYTGDFTYTAKLDHITDLRETVGGVYVHIKLTITMNGERTYPDIGKVVFEDFTAPFEGLLTTACGTDVYRNNCSVSSATWLGDVWGESEFGVHTFVAGEIYTYKIVLTAKDGYRFDENATVIMTNVGSSKAPANYAYSNDYKTLTLNYSYSIQGLTYLNGVEASVVRWHDTITPIAGESALYLASAPYDAFEADENEPYHIVGVMFRTWYDEDGNELYHTDLFEAGKTYYFEVAYSIKQEEEHLYRFAPENLTTTITGQSYTGKGFQKAERVETDNHDNTYVNFRYYFTAQFPDGEGSSAGNPARCYTYDEFKYAMENDDIRYVALGNINETMPVGEEGLITAIHVNGIKTLILLGDATFTAPANVATTYAALLHTTQDTTALNIRGTGSLTFKAVANNSYNAVLYNQGGSVNISGGTLIGSYNVAVYGTAIWQGYGDLRITGGQFFAENALAPLALPRSATAVYVGGGQAWIQGGTFKTENVIDTIDLPYGLEIGQNAAFVDLSGGTFYGIKLPKSTTPLANYMDEDLYTPLSNEHWFNPASEYSQEYTESGKVVRIVWLIDHVDVHVNAPIAGVDITENYFNIPTSGCQATMYYPQWYKNGEIVTYGTFEAGASYKVVVQIDAKADYGAEFANGVTVEINNRSVAVDRKSAHWLEVEYDFGACPNSVPIVELTVTAPVEGNTPSYTVGTGSDAYYAVGGSSNYSDYRKWYMSSDNDEWWEINETHTFMPGYYYKFVTEIRTNNGYEFPLIDNGTIEPNVSATVNGYYADVYKAYEQDPSRHITVEYNFGECNDSVVDNIIIYNVTEPVAGEKPSYTYSISGSGYQMDTGRNAYYDDWMHNQKLYYVKNGISWWDVTDGGYEYVYENDSFIPGHEYQCKVYLKIEDGFEFANDDGTPTVSATMNGKVAGVKMFGSNLMWEQEVTYTFVCKQPEVKTVMLYDLDEPKSGETPDTDVTSAYPEYYEVTEVKWLDEEDGEVEEFEQGRLYTVEITVSPKDYDGEDGCVFAEEAVAYIDGKEVTGWSNRVTVNNDNTLTVRYQFRKGASAPENILYVFVTQPRGGELKAGETHNASWETSFVPDKVEIQYWDGEEWSQWDIYEPENASDSYSFESSEAAAYRFRVVVYAEEAAVATSNEFTVSWEEAENEINYGDVNADGRVDRKDLTRLAQYFARWSVEIDTEASDANGDGRIDRKDLTRLAQYFARWDVELGK